MSLGLIHFNVIDLVSPGVRNRLFGTKVEIPEMA
jgi:hypothetical protein